MRFPPAMKCITMLISIIIISSAILVIVKIIVFTRDDYVGVFIFSHTFSVFKKIAFILSLSLGPYAAFHLWKLREKGRIASLALIIYSLFYFGYSLYSNHPSSHDTTPPTWVAFLATFIALLFLSLPATSKLFNPDKDESRLWYSRVWQNLSVVERLTITISALALIVSFFNTFVAHFYRPDKLLAAVTDISFSDNKLSFPVTFINSGGTYAVVQQCNIVVVTKKSIWKSFMSESAYSRSVTIRDSKTAPELDLILKPGEIKIARIHLDIDVPNIFSIADGDALVAIQTITMDSGGNTYKTDNELGTAQVKDGKIVGLRRKASSFYAIPNGTQSHSSADDVYGIIFKLQ